jgi:hypothetical protein
VSKRIAEILSYSSHFKQTVGAESRRFATEGSKDKSRRHGNKTLLSEPEV